MKINELLHKKMNHKKVLWGILALVISFIILWFMYQGFVQEERRRAIELSQSVATFLMPDMIEPFTASSDDLNLPSYAPIKERLEAFKRQDAAIHFAYLLKMINNKVYFIVDNEESTSPDYSPPGQEYFEATESYKAVFENGQPYITPPIKDRWGTWVTVLVPIRSTKTGDVIAVFGTDYAAKEWSASMNDRFYLLLVIFVCLNIIFIAFYRILDKNKNLIRMEKELIIKEAAFRSVFNQAPVGIAVNNQQEVVTQVNAEFTRILGRSLEELKTVNWRRLTHSDDLAKDEKLFKAFMAKEIDEFSLEKRYLRPNGDEIWVLMQISKYDSGNDDERNYLCIITDISERKIMESTLKESERSKSVLLSNLPGMAYRVDIQSGKMEKVTFLSEGCLSLTGYYPEALIQSRDLNYRDLIAPEYRAAVLKDSNYLLRLRKAFKHEYEIITSSGSRKWVLDLGQGVYDEVNNLLAIEGIVIDITDMKNRESEIRYLSEHDYLTNLFNRRYFESIKDIYDVPENWPLTIMIVDINGLRIVNDAFGHSEGDYLIGVISQIIQKCCSKDDVISRTGGEFRILITKKNEQRVSEISQAIKYEVDQYNTLEENMARHINISVGFGMKSTDEKTWNTVVVEAQEYLNKRKLMERKSYRSTQISSIMATLYARSEETEEHSQRLSGYCKAIGKVLNLSQKDLDELELLSMLHDIGKIGINDNILNKPGPLTEEEWIEMKRHPEIGYRIIAMVPELGSVAEYVLSHHERWDGNGYPHGLANEEIPLQARILSAVDAFDAMTEVRVYRPAMTVEMALEELKNNAGTQFDPTIIDIFIGIIKAE